MAEDDVTTTLDELERKLKGLEDELRGATRGPQTNGGGAQVAPLEPVGGEAEPAGSAPRPASPEPPASSSPEPLASASPREPSSVPPAPGLAQLERFREKLERSARELMAEYDLLLDGLRVSAEEALEAPESREIKDPEPLVARVVHEPEPLASRVVAAPAPSPWPRAAATDAPGLDAAVLAGSITVDAGPFRDIATLSSFEQALGDVSGVEDVHVRGFEASRALIDVTLGRPVALGAELRRSAAVPFTVTYAAAGLLSVAIDS